MQTTKERDIELWKTWKRSHSPMDLQALLKQMDGLMSKEVSRWQGVIAREILEIEAAKLAKQAFESYDPKAGAALSTHVTNYLQKLSRQVYVSQNLARIPEYQNTKVKYFEKSRQELSAQHGREPTASELASHLNWSVAAVEHLRKQIRKESVESLDLKGTPAYGRSEHDVLVDLVYHDLNPVQKTIFESTTGYGGAPVLTGKELTKKLNITQGQLSYQKKRIVDRVKTLMP